MSKQRLYIDESGDHTLKGVTPAQWDKRYLCLLGCQFDEEYCRTIFVPSVAEFKAKHFGGEWDEPIVLHREEICAKTPPFHVLRDRAKNMAYCADLLKLVEDMRFTAYAVLIDKIATAGKWYGIADPNPYSIGLLAMLERYCGKLRFNNETGDVLAEARGKREDGQLKAAYRAIHDGGSRYQTPEFFQKRLSTEIKIKPKMQNICGLQIADLLAYPAKMRMLEETNRHRPASGFTKDIADVLDTKYNRRWANNQVTGYGKVYLF